MGRCWGFNALELKLWKSVLRVAVDSGRRSGVSAADVLGCVAKKVGVKVTHGSVNCATVDD